MTLGLTLFFIAILVFLVGYLVAQLHEPAGKIISIAGAALFVLVWLLVVVFKAVV